VVYRVEDLDSPRTKPGILEEITDTLRWLGIDWDEGPLVQTADLGPCVGAARDLARAGLIYPCALTRREIAAAASAPQEGAGESVFPAALRPPIEPRSFSDTGTNWRFVVPDDEVRFVDTFAGPQRHRPGEQIGDFVVWTRRGEPSYQLAVTVDDHRQGVTRVVRGDDLLPSAARQILLRRALGIERDPVYTHLPLVLGPDGRRLAKRHGDTRLTHYRHGLGVPAERVIGLLARWCGVTERREPLSAAEFAVGLALARMPRDPVVCRPEDQEWLCNGS